MKFSTAIVFLVYRYSSLSLALDLPSLLDGKAGFEYETSPTSGDIKVSIDQCTSCEVVGKSAFLIDKSHSNKVVLKATSDADIASTDPTILIDFNYSLPWFATSFCMMSSDDIDIAPDDVKVFARNTDSDTWSQKDGLLVEKRIPELCIFFKNYEKHSQYRISLSKKSNKETLELYDVSFIRDLTASLSSELLYKVSNVKMFLPSRLKPVQGLMLGIITKPSRNFILKCIIMPHGTISEWGSVIRSRSNPSEIQTSSTKEGDRYPYFSFRPNSYESNISLVDKNGYHGCDPKADKFETNKETSVVIKVVGDKMEIFFDGTSIATKETLLANRSEFDNFYMFTGQKHTKAANVDIISLQWFNVKVE